MESIPPKSDIKFNKIPQAKTQQNSLFLHMIEKERFNELVISQYIPLPNFKDVILKGEYEELF